MIRIRRTYSGCSDLPLHNFIKIVVTGELSWLYSESKSILNRNRDLQELWQDIFNEYSRLSGDHHSMHVLSLLKQITSLNNKLNIVQQAVDLLSQTYDERLCVMLQGMGFRFQYRPESLMNDLRMTISSAKSMLIKKIEAEKEFDSLNQDEKKATEKDYNALITQLSKYMKFRIDPKETSVLDFINYIEAFNQDHKPKQHG